LPHRFGPEERRAGYCDAVTAAEPNLIGEFRLTVGRVTALDSESVTIDTPGGKSQQLAITAQTEVVNASAGAPADVVAGARVVVKYEPGSQHQQAVEVVVLPADSRHGVPVVEAGADSMTIKNLSGTSISVSTDDARIDKTAVGSLEDISDGSMLYIRAKLVGDSDLAADEIIVLPVDTVFGS
jgi:hypothetical protein